jgi:hypothetical protein
MRAHVHSFWHRSGKERFEAVVFALLVWAVVVVCVSAVMGDLVGGVVALIGVCLLVAEEIVSWMLRHDLIRVKMIVLGLLLWAAFVAVLVYGSTR